MAVKKDPTTGRWTVDVQWTSLEGKKYRAQKSTSLRTKRGALALEDRLLESMIDGTYDRKPAAKFDVIAMRHLEDYVRPNLKPASADRMGRAIIRELVPFFGATALRNITKAKLEEYLKACRDRGWSNATTNLHINVYNKIVQRAVEQSLVESSRVHKMKKLKVELTEIKWLSLGEIEELAASKGQPWQDMILTAGHTGMRLGELIALRWSDVDFGRNSITVRHTAYRGKLSSPKGTVGLRTIPMSRRLRDVLAARPHHESCEHIFVNQAGRPIVRVTASQALPGGWHKLRHSFGTNLNRTGKVDLPVLQELMGHSEIKTTMRYLHINDEHRAKAISALDDMGGEHVA